jgi:probable phosphoglycerate mutase
MKKVFLVRHGETAWSLSGQHTGRTDIPLTDHGKKQALSLAPLLKKHSFQKIFVSPLQRAKETYDLLHLSAHAELDEDLYEWDYGLYEGKTSKQIKEIHPNWSLFISGAPGGESVADVGARAGRMLSKIKACQGDVLLFSSGHFLRVLAAKWLEQPPTFGRNLALSTASLSILGYEHHTPALLLWNSTTFS